ncbi:MAG: hypothetical protein ABI867_22430 [Kofleriaceae bacterium]
MIGEALAVACSDPAVLARIGGPVGAAARAAHAEVRESRELLAKIAAAVRAPMPAGIRGVDPSWIEAGLAGLPPRARTALAGKVSTPVDVWLVRWACAAIPPLPAIDPTIVAPRSLDDAIRMSGAALATWLAEVGADQLAHALHSAAPPVIDELVTRVAGDRLRVALARIGLPPRANALGPVRAAIARARPGSDLLVRIGARAIAGFCDGLVRRQVTVRLPRPLGLIVNAELVAHAATPADRGPTWQALAAAW